MWLNSKHKLLFYLSHIAARHKSGQGVTCNNAGLPRFILKLIIVRSLFNARGAMFWYRAPFFPTDNKPQTTCQFLFIHQITEIREVHGVDNVLDADFIFAGIGMVLPVKRDKGGFIIQDFFNFLQNRRPLFQIRFGSGPPWSVHRSWDCSNCRCCTVRSRFPCWDTSPEIR